MLRDPGAVAVLLQPRTRQAGAALPACSRIQAPKLPRRSEQATMIDKLEALLSATVIWRARRLPRLNPPAPGCLGRGHNGGPRIQTAIETLPLGASLLEPDACITVSSGLRARALWCPARRSRGACRLCRADGKPCLVPIGSSALVPRQVGQE